ALERFPVDERERAAEVVDFPHVLALACPRDELLEQVPVNEGIRQAETTRVVHAGEARLVVGRRAGPAPGPRDHGVSRTPRNRALWPQCIIDVLQRCAVWTAREERDQLRRRRKALWLERSRRTDHDRTKQLDA